MSYIHFQKIQIISNRPVECHCSGNEETKPISQSDRPEAPDASEKSEISGETEHNNTCLFTSSLLKSIEAQNLIT